MVLKKKLDGRNHGAACCRSRNVFSSYAFFCGVDTVLLSKTEVDMQRALDATAKYFNENKNVIIVSKTKHLTASRGKVYKT